MPCRFVRTAFVLALAIAASAQPPQEAALSTSAAQGTALRVEVPQSVKENVSLQAVLLPNTITKELFGKHIAENYVAVFVNVGNRSRSAALVLQGLYIDYRNWALSGASRKQPVTDDLDQFSSSTIPGEVASVEYRVVRGQLQDRQPMTGRNWVVRGLQFAGALAAAYPAGGANAVNLVKGISAYNGIAVPGFEKLWPDSLISKLNRISDFGYRANQVVPRESSEVILAFFPIDRFLTPGLKRIFVATPAVFFNPGLAIADESISPELQKILLTISGKETMKQLRDQIPSMMRCHEDREKNKACCKKSIDLRRLVAATSLNSVKIVIDGSMVIDLAAVPAILERVTFETGTDAAAYWSGQGEGKKVIIRGRFLSGSALKIDEAEKLGITDVVVDAKLSDDEQLVATMKFTKAIPDGDSLTLRVIKEAKDGRTTESSPYPYTVKFEAQSPVIVTATVDSNRVLTLTGKNLAAATTGLVIDRTHPTSANFVTNSPLPGQSAAVIKFDLKPLSVGDGCFLFNLSLSGVVKSGPVFSIAPSPKLTSPPVRTANSVKLTGTSLVDLPACGLALSIKVIEDKVGATPQAVTKPKFVSATEATFEFSFPATGALKAQIYQGSKSEPVAEIAIP